MPGGREVECVSAQLKCAGITPRMVLIKARVAIGG